MAAHINHAGSLSLDSRVVEALSGICGGIAVVLVGHPFDTTKTRMQVSPRGYYKGTLDCVRRTLKKEGWRGFYSGMSSPLIGQMFFRAASFTTFHASLNRLNMVSSSDLQNSPKILFAAGGITGFVVAFIEAPIDVVKTKLQIQTFTQKLALESASDWGHPVRSENVKLRAVLPYNSFYSCVAHIVRTNGTAALFQGLSGTLVRNVPANALFFPVNELVKSAFVSRRNKNAAASGIVQKRKLTASDLTLPERLVSGASAGLCYWVLTYPFDAIKGRMQGTPFEQRISWAATARSIFQEYGPRGFLRGIVPCAARSVPACSALFTTMDLVKLRLQGFMADGS